VSKTPVELAVDEAAASLTRTIEALCEAVAGWNPRHNASSTLNAWVETIERLSAQLRLLRRPLTLADLLRGASHVAQEEE
jgi:hypothetical protein